MKRGYHVSMKRKAASQLVRGAKRTRYNYQKRINAYVTRAVPRNRVSVVALGNKSFPDYLDTRVIYYEQVSLTPATGLLSTFVFSCNSIYDPNVSTTGHQPMYRDQLAQIYNRYRVMKSWIEVTAVSRGGPAGHSIVAIRTTNASGTLSTPSTFMEQPGVVSKMLTNSPATVRVTKSWSLRKEAQFANEGNLMNADMGASPSEQEYYHIACFNPDFTATPDKVPFTVRIIYTVRCFDRITSGAS